MRSRQEKVVAWTTLVPVRCGWHSVLSLFRIWSLHDASSVCVSLKWRGPLETPGGCGRSSWHLPECGVRGNFRGTNQNSSLRCLFGTKCIDPEGKKCLSFVKHPKDT